MKTRDWTMAASGAVVASVAVITFYEVESGPGASVRAGREAAQAGEVTSREPGSAAPGSTEPANEEGVGTTAWALKGSSAGGPSAAGSSTEPPVAIQAERLRGKLAEVMRERRDLETQLKTLESELVRSAELPPTGDPRDFDLDREDWKALAAEGRIKYRIPCMMPADSTYTTPPEDLDALGLSPDDGQVLTEAHRRSNARVWGVVRPLCLQAVGTADVVDLLGVSSCLRLIESAATKTDFMAAADARRRVAEVHAGTTPPPGGGEPQSPLFTALMAVTSEAQLFQADLAGAFGPEEAKRIADSMRCVATVR